MIASEANGDSEGSKPASAEAVAGAPSGSVVVETVMVEIVSRRRMSYRIHAARGEFVESSREILLDRPRVEIFGEDAAVRDRMGGESGRFWPVTVKTVGDDGAERWVTKYNWELRGAVEVVSEQGHWVRGEGLVYDSVENALSSASGIEYKVPTGHGSLLGGSARQFRVELDEETGRLRKWTLLQDVQLKSEPEAPLP